MYQIITSSILTQSTDWESVQKFNCPRKAIKEASKLIGNNQVIIWNCLTQTVYTIL